MTMRKTDYEAIAAAIYKARPIGGNHVLRMPGSRPYVRNSALDEAAERIADYCQTCDKDFKRTLFLRQCGVIDRESEANEGIAKRMTIMKTHTPGPWQLVQDQITDGDLRQVAECYYREDMVDGEAEANMALIAAAPDLLAELKGAVEWMEQYENETMDAWTRERLTHSRAAIAKAEGR